MPAENTTGSEARNELSYGIRPRGYRLPDALRLGPVRLQVSDLDRSLAYYLDVLGLRVAHREDGAATLTAWGDETPLVELHEHPGARPVPQGGRLGLYHFAILLPDRADLGRFVAHLGRIGMRAGMADHLVSEAIYLHDPDGLGIEVYADRPRAEWRARDGELLMDTKSLDVRSLVEAGRGAEWSGMPAGTVMGHVHLHVADLEEATAFFHAALGFDAVVWSYPGALFLSAGGYHHHLGLNTWARAGAPPAQADEARLLDWTIVVPRPEDAEAAARSLEAAGYAAANRDDGWTATDPWGTALRIVAAGAASPAT